VVAFAMIALGAAELLLQGMNTMTPDVRGDA
jgi:hypothetical protein